MNFEIDRGINISHWLSQNKKSKQERKDWFTHNDVLWIKEKGFDHIRLPIDESQMWDNDINKNQETFDLLDSAISWCIELNLSIIIDLHIIKSHFFNDKQTPLLFTSKKELDKLVLLWSNLSNHLKHYPINQVAYEILNEPIAPSGEEWNKVLSTVFASLRKLEPARTIIIGSNQFNATNTFHELWIPNDNNIILTFHYYEPHIITHYKAKWWEGGSYVGPITYPGEPLPDYEFKKLNAKEKNHIQNEYYDRTRMLKDITEPINIGRKQEAPLYCGEFGCYASTPREIKLKWYKDIVSILQEHNIKYANWDYKSGFAIRHPEGDDTELINILLQ